MKKTPTTALVDDSEDSGGFDDFDRPETAYGTPGVKKKHIDFVRKGAELPASMLDHTVAAGLHLKDALPNSKILQKSEAYWHTLGPGLTTGASDDDPSGILTYSQTGAKYGL